MVDVGGVIPVHVYAGKINLYIWDIAQWPAAVSGSDPDTLQTAVQKGKSLLRTTEPTLFVLDAKTISKTENTLTLKNSFLEFLHENFTFLEWLRNFP